MREIDKKAVPFLKEKGYGGSINYTTDLVASIMIQFAENQWQTLPIDSVSNSVPTVRVRYCPVDTDETFEGTVIDEKPNYYVVIPDQDSALTQNWNKKVCDVLR